MTPINFRKLVTQKEVVNILTNLASEMGTSFCIEDTFGKSLIGTNSDASASRYPVNLLTEVIGWVIGNQKTATIASLLSYLAQQQYEKKSLKNELTATAIEKALLYEQNYNALQVAQEQAHQLQRTLFELQQTQTKLIQSEKMSSLGQLVADVAHEINNPINFVNGNLSHAQQYSQEILDVLQLYQKHYPLPVPEIQALLEVLDIEFLVNDFTNLLSSMHLGIGRIRQLALSLRNFSRLDQVEMKPVDIHEGIDNTLLILQSKLKPNEKHSGIQLVKEYGNIPLVEGYANQLNQVFMNIIANAIDALEEGNREWGMGNRKNDQFPIPTIQICTLLDSELEDKFNLHTKLKQPRFPSVVVLISDNGLGMEETVRDRLFEPFFTTKSTGKGTGLGLSISYQIIEKHGGSLQCISQPGQGTTFWIQIPINQAL